jgi:DNA polymerase-3 subunit delta'
MSDAQSHPDLDVVGLPKDKSTLPLDLFLGSKEHRNQEGLCHRIALRPYLGGRKVAIIDDADHFSAESANCLLKTLEEPPPKSLMILIGTTPSKQLPTILSRSQVVRFQPLAREMLAEILRANGDTSDPDTLDRLATYGEGSLERIQALADPALWQFRSQLLHDLSSGQANPVRFAKAVQAFVDEAGKEPAQRRERLRTVIGFAQEFHRASMRSEAGGDIASDDLVRSSLSKAQQNLARHDPIASLDASLRALEHIDRNANLGLVVQRWSEEIAGSRVSA